MKMSSDYDDLATWDGDKLCDVMYSQAHIWMPGHWSAVLPPQQGLRVAIRQQGVNGYLFLVFRNEDFLFTSLGVTLLAHRFTLHLARAALQESSEHFRQAHLRTLRSASATISTDVAPLSAAPGSVEDHRLSLFDVPDDSSGVPASPASPSRPPSKKRKLDSSPSPSRNAHDDADEVDVHRFSDIITISSNSGSEDAAPASSSSSSHGSGPANAVTLADEDLSKHDVDKILCAHDDDKLWAECCEFFDHDTRHVSSKDKSHMHRFPHTALELKPFQLYAVYWILSQPLRGIFGALLADEPGLGKSYVVLGLIATRAAILDSKRHMDEHPAEHSGDGAMCPEPYRFGTRCPCLGGAAAEMLPYVREGSPVIISPPSIMDEWVTKFCQTLGPDNLQNGFHLYYGAAADANFDSSGGRVKRLNYATVNGDLAANRLRQPPQYFKTTKKDGTCPVYEGVEIKGRPSQCKHLILLATTCCTAGAGSILFDRKKNNKAKADNMIPNVAVNFIATDEWHMYHGNLQKLTMPFLFARQLLVGSNYSIPHFWLGVSGTPMESGPRDLRVGLAHVQSMQRHSGSLPDCNLDLKAFESAYNQVANKNPEELQDPDTGPMMDDFRAKREEFATQFVIARSGEGFFRGTPLTVVQAAHEREVECPFPEGYDHVLSTEASMFEQRRVQKALIELLKEWRDKGSRGKRPGIPEAKNALLRKTSSATKLRTMRIAASFPALVSLSEHERDSADHLSIEREIVDDLIAQSDQLRTSPYYNRIDEIVQDSPKIPALKECLDALLNDDSTIPGRNTTIKNMVIFAEVPLITYILFCWLSRYYSDEMEILFVHRGLPKEERKRVLARVRDWGNDKPVVLVSTFPLMGTGIGIQRANHMVLFDVALMDRTEAQGIAREVRGGQIMLVQVTRLITTGSCQVETTIRVRKTRRAILNGAV
ncbi:hypothetical protein F5Y16DRAFT_257331 [Xylariaceae sp. FL0255]|nr:hypothetical protein F5Y16DRAFT_257331 [Xylariaceae sp. FL0255]